MDSLKHWPKVNSKCQKNMEITNQLQWMKVDIGAKLLEYIRDFIQRSGIRKLFRKTWKWQEHISTIWGMEKCEVKSLIPLPIPDAHWEAILNLYEKIFIFL